MGSSKWLGNKQRNNAIVRVGEQITVKRQDNRQVRIESVTMKNYRVFQHVELKKMPGLCVFVGANGSAKALCLMCLVSSKMPRIFATQSGQRYFISDYSPHERKQDLEKSIRVKLRILSRYLTIKNCGNSG